MKVWHPDRFGGDARLRVKAEAKLQRINEAYRVLQSDAGAVAGHGVVSTPRYSSSSASTQVAARGRRGPSRVAMGWFYGFVGITLVVFAGSLVIEHAVTRAGDATPVRVQPVAGSSVSEAPGGVSAGHEARPAGSSSRVSHDEDSTAEAQFGVRSLSAAETSRLEEACEPQRDRLGQGAYEVCVAAQVAVITNRAGPPDLSALNAAEHQSIESACAEARRVGGVDGYDRCLTVKMAEWAAEPARPSLSTVNAADRRSVELACRGARDAQGPAAYDRCLVRFMKALAESR